MRNIFSVVTIPLQNQTAIFLRGQTIYNSFNEFRFVRLLLLDGIQTVQFSINNYVQKKLYFMWNCRWVTLPGGTSACHLLQNWFLFQTTNTKAVIQGYSVSACRRWGWDHDWMTNRLNWIVINTGAAFFYKAITLCEFIGKLLSDLAVYIYLPVFSTFMVEHAMCNISKFLINN